MKEGKTNKNLRNKTKHGKNVYFKLERAKAKKREINSAKGFLKKEVQRLNMGKICTELTMELMLLATDCN